MRRRELRAGRELAVCLAFRERCRARSPINEACAYRWYPTSQNCYESWSSVQNTNPGTPNATASAQCSNTVSVTYPDLITSAVTPTTAAVGVAKTFSATITNVGGAATGAAFFTTLFQKATDSSGTGATDIGTDADTALNGANATESTTLSYTFSSAGTYYVRACADKSSSANTGVITESNSSGTGETEQLRNVDAYLCLLRLLLGLRNDHQHWGY